MRIIGCFVLATALSFGCDSDGDDAADTSAGADTATSAADTSDGDVAPADVDPATGCGAKVLIAFFTDENCTEQAGQRVYDTGQTCFGWESSGSHAGSNSATRFQCYRDRLCYTQHPETLTCEGGSKGQTDKEARLGECLKEVAGSLYSKLISGTEACPEAPVGFACPASGAEDGTAGIAACGEVE